MSGNTSTISYPNIIVNACAVVAVAIACAVLAGWWAEIDSLKSVIPGFPRMKPNTAVAFAFAGAGLFFAARSSKGLERRYGLVICGAVVSTIGIITLLEYLGGVDLGTDMILFRVSDLLPGVGRPGLMSPHSGLNFTLVGISLILISGGASKFAELLTMVVRLVTIVALLGLLYGADQLYGVTRQNAMAVHTALLFLVVTTGMGLADRDSHLFKMLFSRAPGASVGCRTIPAVLIVPPVIGLILQAGFLAGYYDANFRLALTIAFSMIVMSLVLFYFSLSLDELDLKRQKIAADLEEKEARYRELFDYSQGLICIHDLNGNLTTVNRAALQMLGFDEREIVGKNLRLLVSSEHQRNFDAYLREVTHEGISSGLLALKTKAGQDVVLRYNNVLAMEEGKEPYILGHAQNVTELLEAQNQLKNLSLTDDLTGLYNRRGFMTLAEQQLKLERHGGTARGLALLFVDMDGLKAINDNYGHDAGSDAIKTLGRLIKSAVREADVVARWGGDEFIILTIGAQGESPHIMVERINSRIDEHNAETDLDYTLACSIGVAPVNVNERSFNETIAEADIAMYAEKKRRKAAQGDITALNQPPLSTVSSESAYQN